MNTKGLTIGTRAAQRLTMALSGMGIPYADLERVIYREFHNIAGESRIGDWLELPNGTTYTLTFKPDAKRESA